MLLSVNRHNFKSEVIAAEGLVFVNFWTIPSADCRNMRSVMRELDSQLCTVCKFVEVDWELEKELGTRYDVNGVPTLLIFDKGRVIGRYSGLLSGDEFLHGLRKRGLIAKPGSSHRSILRKAGDQ